MAGLTITELLNPDPEVNHNTIPMAVPSSAELLKSLDHETHHSAVEMAEPTLAELLSNLDSDINHHTAVPAEPSLAELLKTYATGFNYTFAAMAEPTLAERVQDLPADLYYDILELTLLIKPGVVHINKDYKLPAQLQISRSTRPDVAKQYLSDMIFTFQADTAFIVSGDSIISYTAPYLTSFIQAIPEEHRKFVRKVRLQLKGEDTRRKSAFLYPMEWDEAMVAATAQYALKDAKADLQRLGAEEVEVRANIWEVGEDGGTDQDWWSHADLRDLLGKTGGMPRSTNV